MKHPVLLILLASALCISQAEAGVYKCVGEDGKIRYSNSGCPGQKSEKVTVQDSGATNDSPESMALQNVVEHCDLRSAVILNKHLEARRDDMMQKRARDAYKQCGAKAKESNQGDEALNWEVVRQGGNPYAIPGGSSMDILLEQQEKLEALEKRQSSE